MEVGGRRRTGEPAVGHGVGEGLGGGVEGRVDRPRPLLHIGRHFLGARQGRLEAHRLGLGRAGGHETDHRRGGHQSDTHVFFSLSDHPFPPPRTAGRYAR